MTPDADAPDAPELHHLVGLLGTDCEAMHLVGSYLGKEGTQSDMTFYNRMERGHVWCVVSHAGYPDKLKPLVQVMRLTRVHVLVLNVTAGITPLVGELVVALDTIHQLRDTTPIVVITGVSARTEYLVPEFEHKVRELLGTTSLDPARVPLFAFRELADRARVKDAIVAAHRPPEALGFAKVLVDHSFPVKGIGTVILGIVESGTVRAGEMLELTGLQKKVIIRSIQKQDREFKTASAGDRVGLAIKGVKPSDIGRDDLLVTPGNARVTRDVTLELQLNPFFKHAVEPGEAVQYHLVANLATTPVKVVGGARVPPGGTGTITLRAEKEIPVDVGGTPAVLVSLDKFEGQLRVLGGGLVQAA